MVERQKTLNPISSVSIANKDTGASEQYFKGTFALSMYCSLDKQRKLESERHKRIALDKCDSCVKGTYP